MTERVSRRALGLLPRPPRRAAASPRSPPRSPTSPLPASPSRPDTPAGEMASWLPEEMCTTCGAPVTGSHQLYCSEDCKQQDSCRAAQSLTGAALALIESDDKTHALAANDAPQSSSTSAPVDDQDQADPHRFRYPCPPSPLLVAQMQTTTTDNARKQPSFNALGKFDKLMLRHRSSSKWGPGGDSSADEDDRTPAGFSPGRRDSVGSIESTGSSGAVMTDPSDPSPAISATARQGFTSEDERDLDAVRLPPPSMKEGHDQVTSSSSSSAASSSSSQGSASSPRSNNHRRRQGPPADYHEPLSTSTMSFARRPSSTNLPAPTHYSPVLMASHGRRFASQQDVTTRTSYRKANRPTRSAAGASEPFGQATPRGRRGPSAATRGGQSRSPSLSSHRGASDLLWQPASASTSVASLSPKASPPAEQSSRGSTSLVAGSLIDGISTSRHSSSSSGTVSPAREFCGRPGCSGTSVASKVALDFAVKRQGVGSEDSKSQALPSDLESSRPPHRVMSRQHRHTHSALDVFGMFQPRQPAHQHLHMTPATSARQARKSDPSIHSRKENVTPLTAHDRRHPSSSHTDERDSRGRSKDRGPRSTSRRNRSPPRAAARGRSETLHTEERSRKKVNTHGSSSPSREAVPFTRPSSHPIAIAKVSASHSSGSAEEFSFESDDESDLEVDHHRRRGRSPRDRRSRMASVTTKVSNHGTIKASKVKHNGESSSYRKASYCDQVAAVDPGFDAVEDLEV